MKMRRNSGFSIVLIAALLAGLVGNVRGGTGGVHLKVDSGMPKSADSGEPWQ